MVLPIAAILGAAAISGVASLAGGVIQSNAAQRASDTQAASAQEALDYQKQVDAQAREDALPWMEAGRTALTQYHHELGLGPAAEGATGFQETPGYQFAVEQGEKGVLNNLAALGMKNSGSALKALTDYRLGMANQEYGNYMNRLSAAAGQGQQQVNQTNALSSQNAQVIGNTMQGAGAARASGYVGGANAWSNALQGVSSAANNALGWMAYPGGQTGFGGGSTPIPNALGGGTIY